MALGPRENEVTRNSFKHYKHADAELVLGCCPKPVGRTDSATVQLARVTEDGHWIVAHVKLDHEEIPIWDADNAMTSATRQCVRVIWEVPSSARCT